MVGRGLLGDLRLDGGRLHQRHLCRLALAARDGGEAHPKGVELAILDDGGQLCFPRNSSAPSTPSRQSGRYFGIEYFNAPDKTAASRKGDYFTVGDMGYLDDEGWLFLSDRRVDLIISGGVNIYPAAIRRPSWSIQR